MNGKFWVFVLITCFVISCQQQNKQTKKIDYSTLKEIKVTLDVEIGSQTGEPFSFGRLRDLVVSDDGYLIVSDVGKTTIEQFAPDGRHVGTIAQKGKAPGELASYFTLIEGTKDRLIVSPIGMSNRIDYFKQNGEAVYTYQTSQMAAKNTKRYIEVISTFSDSLNLALTGPRYQSIAQYASEQSDYRKTQLAVVKNFDAIVQDSLHQITTPAPLVDLSNNSMNVLGMPPYQYRDRVRVVPTGGYAIAQADSGKINFYDANHTLQKSLALTVKQRPVEESDLSFHFDLMDISDPTVRRKMEERIPENKPAFLNMWISENYIWLHVDTTGKGKQFVVLNLQGEPIGTFHLAPYDEIQTIRDTLIYTLNKNPTEGHSIRVYRAVVS